MSIVSGTGSASGFMTANASSTAGVANNFNSFLQLLTTQLRNQNPLDPLDTNQFTQQLTQFAGVEQQIRTNEMLTALLSATQANQISSSMGYLGATVKAEGSTVQFDKGEAKWQLTAEEGAEATITIRDMYGNVVHTEETKLKDGEQTFSWNGKSSTGLSAEGFYTISVEAKDSSGKSVDVKTEIEGIVDGVDLSSGTPVLKIGDFRLPLSSVTSVERRSS